MNYRPIAWIALCAIIAIGIQAPMSKKLSTSSTVENVPVNNSIDSDIQRLTLEKNKRRNAAESWDRWNIRFLFLAGLAATCLVVTAVGVSRSNRALINASDELGKAKDAKLATDLASKDVEIARATGLAGTANQKAGEANQRAGFANERAGEANKRAEELKAQNLATEAKLERERLERVRLQEATAPRIAGATGEMLNDLGVFAGTTAVIGIISGDDSQQLAGNIRFMLTEAKWNVLTIIPAGLIGMQGIEIRMLRSRSARTDDAARILSYSLKANGIATLVFDDPDPTQFPADFSADMILILISQNPKTARLAELNNKLIGDRMKESMDVIDKMMDDTNQVDEADRQRIMSKYRRPE